MNRNLFIATVVLLLLASCGPEEKPGQLMAVNNSLEQANNIIDYEIKMDYAFLEGKLRDPQTADITAIWKPRVDEIKLYADSIRDLIKSIKGELISQSDSLKRKYVTVVKQLYDANGVGGKLLNKLAAFKDSIPFIIYPVEVIDSPSLQPYQSEETGRLLSTFPILPGYQDSLSYDERENYRKRWREESFGGSSSLMAMVMLNKIENDVLVTEKICIDYCKNHTSGCVIRYDVFRAMAFLNSRYVKSGQMLEVTAGVGAFNDAMKPRITINGKEIKLEDAVALYRFPATGSAGKHNIDVEIEFVRPDGNKVKMIKTLEYIIAE